MSKIKIIKTLKKMMLHERSARLIGNTEEADRYAEKIALLRAKHNVTQEIPLDEEYDFDTFGGEPVFTPSSPLFRKKRVFWEEAIFDVVCHYFGCRALAVKKSNLKIVIGEKQKRARVIKTYLHLTETAGKHLKEYLGQNTGYSAAESRLHRESFLHGFASMIQQRIVFYERAAVELERIEKDTGEKPSRLKDSTALVTTNKIVAPTEKRKEIEREVSKIKKTPPPKITRLDDNAFSAGQYAGANCSLNDELALPAKQTLEDLMEVQENIRRKEQERMRRSYSGTMTVFYGTTASTAFTAPVQMTFSFDDED